MVPVCKHSRCLEGRGSNGVTIDRRAVTQHVSYKMVSNPKSWLQLERK